MAYAPKAVCAHCNVPLTILETGHDLEAIVAATGRSYYKVAADLWACPQCGIKVYMGFGKPIENYDPRYDSFKTDKKFTL